MHKLYTLFWLLALLPLTLKAEKWTPETLPMVYLEDSTRYICNPDGVLSPQATAQGDRILRALETDKGVQTVVVAVKQLEGDDPYTFGMALGRKYGIGSKKQRTGLIIILATEDRSYQILTGNGLEGTLPDAICRRIQNRKMVPELKRGNWDGAILNTLESIDHYVRLDPALRAETKENSGATSKKALIGFSIAMAILGGCLLFAVAIVRIENKCTNCRQAQMRPVKRQRMRHPGTGRWYIHTTLRCPRCGHEKTVDEDEDDHFANGGPVPPFFMGGGRMGRGGSSSGGFGGGIFGGGSFGGGGSGGRF